MNAVRERRFGLAAVYAAVIYLLLVFLLVASALSSGQDAIAQLVRLTFPVSAVTFYVLPINSSPVISVPVLLLALVAQVWLLWVVIRGPVARGEEAGAGTDLGVRVVRWGLYTFAAAAFLNQLVRLPSNVSVLLGVLLEGWLALGFFRLLPREFRFHRLFLVGSGMVAAAATFLRALTFPFGPPVVLDVVKLLQFVGFVWLASVVVAQMRDRRWSTPTISLGWVAVLLGAVAFSLDNLFDFGLPDPPFFTLGQLHVLASILWAVRSAHELVAVHQVEHDGLKTP
ncbi:hypothetical protein [Microbispora sp. H10949]|uniref:hypothetical protein n=1 Tax=Microbispora sp. H10949 TaxID=2729111 RepID=UPI001600DC3E|nr:hypothetical protein [Microbispora sp. H10949]